MLHHAAVQGAQGHAACGWHERFKREWVLGAVGRELLPMGLGRADTLRGFHVVGDNAQPLGGRSMRWRRFIADCWAALQRLLPFAYASEAVVGRNQTLPDAAITSYSNMRGSSGEGTTTL